MEVSFDRRKILTPVRLRELAQKSDLRGWAQALSHFGAIMLTGALMTQLWDSWLIVPVFMAHGVLINFLYAGQHELSHGTPFQTKWINEWVGRIIGFIVIYPRDFDQIQHFAHHQHTSDWERTESLRASRIRSAAICHGRWGSAIGKPASPACSAWLAAWWWSRISVRINTTR